MTPTDFVTTILSPGLVLLKRVGGVWSDDRASSLLTSIAGQESGMTTRCQTGGPARGWFQMERAGGVRGVLDHPLSSGPAAKICAELCIPHDEATVYEAMAWSDNLSVAFARLLLWTDPSALPDVGQQAEAWAYYCSVWRPGKPRPATWSDHYSAALAAIKSPEGAVAIAMTREDASAA